MIKIFPNLITIESLHFQEALQTLSRINSKKKYINKHYNKISTTQQKREKREKQTKEKACYAHKKYHK